MSCKTGAGICEGNAVGAFKYLYYRPAVIYLNNAADFLFAAFDGKFNYLVIRSSLKAFKNHKGALYLVQI